MSRRHFRSRRQFLTMAGGATAALAAGTVTATAGPALAATREAGKSVRGEGITWPPGQALPRFAPPTRLDVADMTGVAADEQLLLTTLQSVVNRRQPRIYLLQPQNEPLYAWVNALGVKYQVLDDALQLLSEYRGEITGAVLYDENVPGTMNVATTLAGLHDGVATSAALADSTGLPVLADLRGEFASDLDAYTWAAANLWQHTSHRLLIGLDPGISGYLRDYAVANRAFVMFLDPSVPAELTLLEQLLADIPPGSPYMGWWPSDVTGESDGTQVTSQYGLTVVASDYSANLTVFGGARAPVSAAPQQAPVPPLRNKIYVTFTVTDGDNLQYNQHRMRQIWDDPDRGKVPLNWTVQPLGVDAAPTFLSYYQRTASGNDYLMAGPSGAGYVYPGDWPADQLNVYTGMTRRYLDRTGIDTAVILNRVDGQDIYLDAETAGRYIADVRPLGLLESWTTYTWTSVVSGTPVSVSWQVSSVEQAQQVISAASAGWDGGAPTGLMDWQGPVENGVGSIPGTIAPDVTTPQGASAVQWTETSVAPDSWIWVDPAAQLAAGNYYEVSVTVQGKGDIYLDFWNGQWDLTTGALQLTSAPQTLTLQAWVPVTGDTHLQVRTAATGPVGLYASAASIRLLE